MFSQVDFPFLNYVIKGELMIKTLSIKLNETLTNERKK